MSSIQEGSNDICRLCAFETETGVQIYSPEGERACLEKKIIACLRVEVSRDDFLPKKVCSECNAMLEELYMFTSRVACAQRTLSFLFDVRLRQLQDQDLNSPLGVKLEGSLIKDELEDLKNYRVGALRTQYEASNYDVLSTPPHDPSLRLTLLPSSQPKEKIDIGFHELLDDDDMNLTDDASNEVDWKKRLQPKGNDSVLLDDLAEEPQVTAENTSQKNFTETDEDDHEEVLKPAKRRLPYNSNNTTKNWAITCSNCRKVFALRADFEAHCRDVHGEKPGYTCTLCGKVFYNFTSYRSHYYRHESVFSCLYCDKVFNLEAVLRLHVLTRHITIRPFTCDVCDRGFTTQRQLDIHRKLHEESQTEFRCNQCNKVLLTRNGLNAHLTVHRYGRRFQCDLCGKTFTQKINMQQHARYHKGERPFACDLCNKRFAEKSHLKRHKIHHSAERPFQCPVCLKMYKTERCLKVHSHVHEKTRPYVCQECGKGFLNVTKLKQHYHCHTGERPFACKYCDRAFNDFSNWHKHVRRRHKVDHITGAKLKEEELGGKVQKKVQKQLPPEQPQEFEGIDFFNMADVKIKDDDFFPHMRMAGGISPYPLPDIDDSQPL